MIVNAKNLKMGEKVVIQITGMLSESIAQVVDFDESSNPIMKIIAPEHRALSWGNQLLKNGDYIIIGKE